MIDQLSRLWMNTRFPLNARRGVIDIEKTDMILVNYFMGLSKPCPRILVVKAPNKRKCYPIALRIRVEG